MQSATNSQVGGLITGQRVRGRAEPPISFVKPDLHSNPSEHKLLTPRPTPTPQNVISSFRG